MNSRHPPPRRSSSLADCLIAVALLGFVGAVLWLCATYPLVPFLLLGGTWAFGVMISMLAAAQSPSKQSGATPAPNRQRDTLTPLLLGLALGWWLGGGPGDGDC